jgi:hypothetical protein
LNDLPENHHTLAIQSVTEGLREYEDVFIMVAGKDFSQQVFPNNTIDLAFSNMTLMILPLPPSVRTDNVFFFSTPEKLNSDLGKIWIEGFTKHWTQFVTNR